MSSDILYEEVICNLNKGDPKFLTCLSKKKDVTMDELNLAIISEKVKMDSLIRQHELLVKLNLEIPTRFEKLEIMISKLVQDEKELKSKQIEQEDAIERIRNQGEKMKLQLDDICRQICENREIESLSLFQREKVWELITRVVDLRKRVLSQKLLMISSEKDRKDYEYISKKIEENEICICKIQEIFNLGQT